MHLVDGARCGSAPCAALCRTESVSGWPSSWSRRMDERMLVSVPADEIGSSSVEGSSGENPKKAAQEYVHNRL